MASQLIAVVLHLGRSKLEAVLDDGTGMRRRINLDWLSRARGDMPPKDWLSQCEGEVVYQKGQADPLKKLMGGMPG